MDSKIQKIKDNILIQNHRENLQLVLQAIPEELNKYELSNFINAVLKEEVVNSTFVAELIATYNPKKRTAEISGNKLKVTVGALGDALHLPDTKNVNVDEDEDEDEEEAIDFDDNEEDEEYAIFLHNFVMTYMYLNPEQKVDVVAKVHKMCDCLIVGHPKDFDFRGFMWVLVENELLKGTDIKECNYAQHMQCLIRNQLSDLFVVTTNNNDDDAGGAQMDDDDAGGAQMDVDAGAQDLNFNTISGSGSGKNQFKRRRRNNYKAGTASGSDSLVDLTEFQDDIQEENQGDGDIGGNGEAQPSGADADMTNEHPENAEVPGAKKLVMTDEYFQRVTKALVMRLRQHEETVAREGTGLAGMRQRDLIQWYVGQQNEKDNYNSIEEAKAEVNRIKAIIESLVSREGHLIVVDKEEGTAQGDDDGNGRRTSRNYRILAVAPNYVID